MSHALEVLGRLRKLAVEQARRDLAARLAAEAAAEAAGEAALAGMQREREHAQTLRVEEAGGAFAAWLPRGMQAIAMTRDASVLAVAAVEAARTALAGARASGEAVQQMLAHEAAALAVVAGRKEQASLDEMARRRIVLSRK